jgi:hypothetical protein
VEYLYGPRSAPHVHRKRHILGSRKRNQPRRHHAYIRTLAVRILDSAGVGKVKYRKRTHLHCVSPLLTLLQTFFLIALSIHRNANGLPKDESKSGCAAYDLAIDVEKKKKVFGGYVEGIAMSDRENGILKKSLYCDGDDPYWFVSVTVSDDPGLPIGMINALPGWDKLNGKDYGGLTRDEIAQK